MPAIYAHHQFGERVYAALPEAIKRRITPHKGLFDIGQHGPDIFFYYEALKGNPVSRMGFDTHKLTGREVFTHGAKAAAAGGDAALAYGIGYVCHFVLDRACHSYVEKAEQVLGCSHTHIEAELERHLMLRDGIRHPVWHRLTRHILPTKAHGEVIAPFFTPVTGEQTAKALRSLISYNKLLRCPCPLKRGVIYGGLRLAGKYPYMGGLIIRYAPTRFCLHSSKALMALADAAVETALQCIHQFMEAAEGDLQALGAAFDDTFGAKAGWEALAL